MRCITKQNGISRTRLKFVQIVTLQDKVLATEWPEMRDVWLASKAKLKGGQIQDRAQENSTGDITYTADSINPKCLGVLYSSSIILAISTRVRFFRSTTPLCCGTHGVENC
jgi:hypothetical protein